MLNWAIRYAPIVSFVKKHSPKTILEIGSGAQGLAYYIPEISLVGTDVKFSSPIQNNLRPVIASVENQPFQNGSFDMVVSSDMLEHLPENARRKAVHEILRVARKYAVIGFPCGEIAEHIDRQIYETLSRLEIDPPPWLLEHFLNPYPTSESIIGLLPESNIAKRIIKNCNCWIHKTIIVGEMKPRIYRLLSRLDRINLIRALSPLINLGRTYREIIIIEKLVND